MSNSKILYQISGSIAAYKSATIISKLVQSGFEVQTVVTDSALNFIGAATLEGLTGKPVLIDMFEPGQLMNHINLIKWADVVVLAPATANTINRLAQGLADDLVGALFLAHDMEKPYLLAPAMNTKMFQHPATQRSLKQLSDWGVTVLPTASGYLACGDEGAGKMLEPEEIVKSILQVTPGSKGKNILITSGGTREKIDAVRFISNISTGQTGAALADAIIKDGHAVTFLHGQQSQLPNLICEITPYISSQDLKEELQRLLSTREYDMVIHLAAVSDYIPMQVETSSGTLELPIETKLNSDFDHMSISLERGEKLVQSIKNYSNNKALQLVAFKLTVGVDLKEQRAAVEKLYQTSHPDLIVANDMQDRDHDRQMGFRIFSSTELDKPHLASDVSKLARLITDKLLN